MKTKKLDKRQLRLRILKDAKQQIQLGHYNPNTGRVIDEFDILGSLNIDYASPRKRNWQPLLKKLRKTEKVCQVCARGALLLSSIVVNNNCVITPSDFASFDDGSFDRNSSTDQKLATIFSNKQIEMMECAFEVGFGHGLDWEVRSDCMGFGAVYGDPTDRLIAILDNAIKNRGTFKPEQV